MAAGRAELDSCDIVEGRALAGGRRIEVLNGLSLHGGLPSPWPQQLVSATSTVAALLPRGREFGLPAYAQFDHHTICQGGHRGRDFRGRVIRICWQLGLTPVCAPPQQPGCQAAIDHFHGRGQAQVWSRCQHNSLAGLPAQSRRYLRAYRPRAAARIDDAPQRRSLPSLGSPISRLTLREW